MIKGKETYQVVMFLICQCLWENVCAKGIRFKSKGEL